MDQIRDYSAKELIELNMTEEDYEEEKFQERRAQNLLWLEDHRLAESDVMEDENGEYVYVENEDGLQKTYLPYANATDLAF